MPLFLSELQGWLAFLQRSPVLLQLLLEPVVITWMNQVDVTFTLLLTVAWALQEIS